MKKIHKERLLKLYEHIQQPQKKLAHKRFDFGTFNTVSASTNKCGTNGCMMGELPMLFPNKWEWHDDKVLLIKGSSYSVNMDLSSFFGLTDEEVEHITYPGMQHIEIDPYYEKHDELSTSATKRQVVANLRRFLKIKGILN